MSRCLCLLALVLALRAESVVVLGDSITAGYGLAAEQAYPALLGAALPGWTVVNAGVSGDTSAGGLRRLDWVLKGKPRAVIIALGANDGLRGLPVDQLEANLRAMVAKVRAAGAAPLLIGMRMPKNLGPGYIAAFDALYPRLAKELDVPLLPFLLDGVAMDPALNQSDLVHPNAKGQQVIAGKVAAWLKPLLPAVGGQQPAASSQQP
jgi:acyl-CoA thioesterase-1